MPDSPRGDWGIIADGVMAAAMGDTRRADRCVERAAIRFAVTREICCGGFNAPEGVGCGAILDYRRSRWIVARHVESWAEHRALRCDDCARALLVQAPPEGITLRAEPQFPPPRRQPAPPPEGEPVVLLGAGISSGPLQATAWETALACLRITQIIGADRVCLTAWPSGYRLADAPATAAGLARLRGLARRLADSPAGRALDCIDPMTLPGDTRREIGVIVGAVRPKR